MAHWLDFHASTPLINAPCPLAWHPQQLQELADSPLGAIMTKSVTLAPRQGNPTPREYYSEPFTLNAVGLANDGIQAHLDYLAQVQTTKPRWLSVSGFTVTEYCQLVELATASGVVDAIELNLSCPNTESQLFADSPDAVAAILQQCDHTLPLGLKLPPLQAPPLQAALVQVATAGGASFLTASNTLGHCRFTDPTGQSVLTANGGYGGLSGPALLPASLATVSSLRTLLDAAGSDITLIGVGGVQSAADVHRYLAAGADRVGLASALHVHGLGIIDQIVSQL